MAELVLCVLVAEVVFFYSHRILHHRWSDLHLHIKIKFVMHVYFDIKAQQRSYLSPYLGL